MLKHMQGTMETASFARDRSEPCLEICHSLLRGYRNLLLDWWK